MRLTLRAAILLTALIPSLAAAPATAPAAPAGGVTVIHTKPKVITRTFDPARPPSDMPPLQPNEAALCQSKFGCGVQIEVNVQPREDKKPLVIIEAIRAELTLEVVIWLPTKAPAKIRAHEDGHRQIAEHFYKDADAVAKKFADRYIGKQFVVDSIDRSHTQPTIQRTANELIGQYMGETEVPMEKAQQKFDALTDHGRNNLSEKEAIKRSLAD